MFSALDWKPGLKAKSKLISDIDYAFIKKLPTDKPNRTLTYSLMDVILNQYRYSGQRYAPKKILATDTRVFVSIGVILPIFGAIRAVYNFF